MAGASAGLELPQERDKDRRETLVAAAIGDGRIPPARKEHWIKALEVDFEGNSQVLASLEAGLIPVNETGTGSVNDDGTVAGPLADGVVQGWTDTFFPEVKQRRAEDVAVAAGQGYPLIQRGGD